MRPKRVILYVHWSEISLSLGSFILETRGYRIIRATTQIEAIEQFRRGPDAVIIELFTLPITNYLARQLRGINPEVPIVLIGKARVKAEAEGCVAPYLGQTVKVVEVLEHLRIVLTRKRGPKKRPAQVVIEEHWDWQQVRR